MRPAIVLLLLAPAAWTQQSELWMDLSGLWRSHLGDRPEYAQTDFDDRAWEEFELPQGRGTWYTPLAAPQRKIWLRKRIVLPGGADRKHLTLTLGAIEDVYEIYINGRQIGGTGSFESFENAQTARPRTFDIPDMNSDELQIAIRLRRALVRPAWIRMPDRGPYVLASSPAAPRDAGWANAARQWMLEAPRLIFSVLILVVALLAFLGWRMEPARYEFLWFAAGCAVWSFNALYGAWMLTDDARPFNRYGTPAIELLTSVLRWPLFAEFAIAALGIRSVWIRCAIWLSFSPWALLARFGETPNLIFDVRPIVLSTSGINLTAAFAMLIIAVEWLRVGRRLGIDGHLFRFVLLLPYVPRLIRFRRFVTGSYNVDAEDVGMLAVSALTLGLLFRRLAADRRERLRLAEELEAARAVQQLLLPLSQVGEKAFDVQVIYEPMQEVGGDFHWAHAAEGGSLIVVVGDVSGKGLKAAMLVSVAVGILSNEKSTSPAVILAALNDGLTGNTAGGFVTCCCARFDPDGCIAVANAGHPEPYCDGREVECEAGLPLGLESGIEYGESSLRGSRFTFVSDGVVEAANSSGELFGFERTRDISTSSAQDIAEAAKAWGQNDDITVVTIQRIASNDARRTA